MSCDVKEVTQDDSKVATNLQEVLLFWKLKRREGSGCEMWGRRSNQQRNYFMITFSTFFLWAAVARKKKSHTLAVHPKPNEERAKYMCIKMCEQ
jgi:hypothetical protein